MCCVYNEMKKGTESYCVCAKYCSTSNRLLFTTTKIDYKRVHISTTIWMLSLGLQY